MHVHSAPVPHELVDQQVWQPDVTGVINSGEIGAFGKFKTNLSSFEAYTYQKLLTHSSY